MSTYDPRALLDETDECLNETTCYCDRYEPKEGQGR